MNSAQEILSIADISLYEGYVMLSVQLVYISVSLELTVFCGQIDAGFAIYELFMLFSVVLELFNGYELHIVFLCQFYELRSSHHSSVFFHDFAAKSAFF